MTRLASILLFLLLALASPAWACQYGVVGTIVAAVPAVNIQTISVGASTAVGFTLPTTYGNGSAFAGKIYQASVYVTSGTINATDNGSTPTTSSTAGGAPFGSSAAGGQFFDVCGVGAVTNFRMISQTGTSTVVVMYYGQ